MYSPQDDSSLWNQRSQRLRNAMDNSLPKQVGRRKAARQPIKKPLYMSGSRLNEKIASNAKTDVRKAKYDVVPPLRPKSNAYERNSNDDDDSWGERSDEEQSETGNSFLQPRMSFAKPAVVYPGSLREPDRTKRKTDRQKIKAMKKLTNEVGVSTDTLDPYPLGNYSSGLQNPSGDYSSGLQNVHFARPDAPANFISSSYPQQGMYVPYMYYPPVHTMQYQYDPRLQYIGITPHHFNHQQSTKHDQESVTQLQHETRRDREQLKVDKAALHFYDKEGFAKSFTEEFIEKELRGTIIPDVLIEVLEEMYPESRTEETPLPPHWRSPSHRQHDLAISVPEALPHPGWAPRQRHDIIRPSDPQREIWQQNAVAKDLVLDIINEHVKSEVTSVVKEVSHSYVNEFMMEGKLHDIYSALVDEVIRESCITNYKSILEESTVEVVAEEACLEPVLKDLLEEVVLESLEEQDKKEKEKTLEEISKCASTKFLDSLALDYFLTQIARQAEVWNENEQFERLIDSMILDKMLRMQIGIPKSSERTLSNKPIRRYHENLVTDVLTDTLLNELCLSLDQDMLDIDEQEYGQL